MNFKVLTLFPDMIKYVTDESIIGRAQKAGYISVEAYNIRDYSKDKHRRVDDTPYGGGMGMLIAAPAVCDAYDSVKSSLEGSTHTVYMSPRGKVLTHKKALELSAYDNLIILCGHYEGVDQRALDYCECEEISIGDYVLTGGELPACILIDCVARLCDGVLADDSCYEDESIASGLLEYPQYTRPEVFKGESVPSVLLEGNHAKIEKWRREKAVEITKKQRPDLI